MMVGNLERCGGWVFRGHEGWWWRECWKETLRGKQEPAFPFSECWLVPSVGSKAIEVGELLAPLSAGTVPHSLRALRVTYLHVFVSTRVKHRIIICTIDVSNNRHLAAFIHPHFRGTWIASPDSVYFMYEHFVQCRVITFRMWSADYD